MFKKFINFIKYNNAAVLILAIFFVASASVFAQTETKMEDNSNKLAVLWTSGDVDVAEKMCFMYTYNAKKQGWFDEVVLIVWGPSAKLLSENAKLQEKLKEMQEIGIRTEACVVCARMYGVDDDLREMGIDVKGMGGTLSDYLKNRYQILTF